MKHFLIRVATPIVLIVLWQLFADAFGSPRMPRPSAVVASAMKLIGSGELVTALVTSLGRVFSGFMLASAIAIPLGILMGSVRTVERNLDPLVESFRPDRGDRDPAAGDPVARDRDSRPPCDRRLCRLLSDPRSTPSPA